MTVAWRGVECQYMGGGEDLWLEVCSWAPVALQSWKLAGNSVKDFESQQRQRQLKFVCAW